jgi:hypothetical protein
MVAGSPFIVRLFHTWDVQETRCFALEHVSGGDLFDLLKKERRFESARAAKYVLQLGQVSMRLTYSIDIPIYNTVCII